MTTCKWCKCRPPNPDQCAMSYWGNEDLEKAPWCNNKKNERTVRDAVQEQTSETGLDSRFSAE